MHLKLDPFEAGSVPGGPCQHRHASEEGSSATISDVAMQAPPTNGLVEPAVPARLPPRDIERYSRQLLLPSFGPSGQVSLATSRVLIIGAGGLGCPAALYLAGAGVRKISIAEHASESVEISNLHRQVLHTTDGAHARISKAESAQAAIAALNPTVSVSLHDALHQSTAVSLAGSHDLVLDCTDNVRTRYLASDACAAAGVPLVSGAALGFDGQLSVYGMSGGPCLRCVFPTPPPAACVGTCDAAGVMGPVVGTVGVLMALEALKILGNVKGARSLAGRLMIFDGKATQFRDVKLRGRNPECVACGDGVRLDVSSFDYDTFVNGGTPPAVERPVLRDEFRISVQQLADMRRKKLDKEFFLLDCRPANQFALCALGNSENVPLSKLDDTVGSRLQKLGTPIVVLCRRGNKSQTATVKLREMGLNDVVDVRGGLQAWHREIDKDFPLY